MKKDEHDFLSRFTNILVRQEQQLRCRAFSIPLHVNGFKTPREVLGSEKWINSHPWMQKIKEEYEEKH